MSVELRLKNFFNLLFEVEPLDMTEEDSNDVYAGGGVASEYRGKEAELPAAVLLEVESMLNITFASNFYDKIAFADFKRFPIYKLEL